MSAARPVVTTAEAKLATDVTPASVDTAATTTINEAGNHQYNAFFGESILVKLQSAIALMKEANIRKDRGETAIWQHYAKDLMDEFDRLSKQYIKHQQERSAQFARARTGTEQYEIAKIAFDITQKEFFLLAPDCEKLKTQVKEAANNPELKLGDRIPVAVNEGLQIEFNRIHDQLKRAMSNGLAAIVRGPYREPVIDIQRELKRARDEKNYAIAKPIFLSLMASCPSAIYDLACAAEKAEDKESSKYYILAALKNPIAYLKLAKANSGEATKWLNAFHHQFNGKKVHQIDDAALILDGARCLASIEGQEGLAEQMYCLAMEKAAPAFSRAVVCELISFWQDKGKLEQNVYIARRMFARAFPATREEMKLDDNANTAANKAQRLLEAAVENVISDSSPVTIANIARVEILDGYFNKLEIRPGMEGDVQFHQTAMLYLKAWFKEFDNVASGTAFTTTTAGQAGHKVVSTLLGAVPIVGGPMGEAYNALVGKWEDKNSKVLRRQVIKFIGELARKEFGKDTSATRELVLLLLVHNLTLFRQHQDRSKLFPVRITTRDYEHVMASAVSGEQVGTVAEFQAYKDHLALLNALFTLASATDEQIKAIAAYGVNGWIEVIFAQQLQEKKEADLESKLSIGDKGFQKVKSVASTVADQVSGLVSSSNPLSPEFAKFVSSPAVPLAHIPADVFPDEENERLKATESRLLACSSKGVAVLQATISKMGADMASVVAESAVLRTKVGELESKLTTVTARADSQQTEIVRMSEKTTQLEIALAVATTKADTAERKAAAAEKKADDLAQRLAAMEAMLQRLLGMQTQSVTMAPLPVATPVATATSAITATVSTETPSGNSITSHSLVGSTSSTGSTPKVVCLV